MKKNLIIIGFTLISMMVMGCATTTTHPIAPVAQTSPAFTKASPTASLPSTNNIVLGKDGVPQPKWVTRMESMPDRHHETGYAKMSDQQNSIKRATVEAKNKMAEWVQTNVKEVILTYVNDAGSGSNRQSLDAMEVISKQVAEASLSGVTTEELWVDADGGVWVLCSIPFDNLENNFKPAAEAVAEAFSENEAADVANAKMRNSYASLLKGTI